MTTIFELHSLTQHTYNVLNRGQNGAQKVQKFGGHTRAVTSSQHEFARMRGYYQENFLDTNNHWSRTSHASNILAKQLLDFGFSVEEAQQISQSACQAIGLTPGDSELTILTHATEMRTLATQIADWQKQGQSLIIKSEAEASEKGKGKGRKSSEYHLNPDLAKALKLAVSATSHPFLSACGRFVAGADHLVQLATKCCSFGLATNIHEPSPNFHICADDTGQPNSHMGTDYLSSPIMYRYCMYEVSRMAAKHGPEIAAAEMKKWTEAFYYGLPPGGRHTVAAFDRPDLLLFVLSQRNQPVRFAGAFVQPSKTLAESLQKLEYYYAKILPSMEPNPDNPRELSAGYYLRPDIEPTYLGESKATQHTSMGAILTSIEFAVLEALK